MLKTDPETSEIRLAEIIAALSLATDLGMGQPLEQALCSSILAVRLGKELGLDTPNLREVYYQALLRYIGCNAESATMAAIVGDELAIRADFATIDNGSNRELISMALRHLRRASAGAPPLQAARQIMRGLLTMPRFTHESYAGHCEVAQRLAERMGFPSAVVIALGQLYERWDGHGQPCGLKGEQIAVAVRIVTLAQDALIYHRLDGEAAATKMVRERTGGAYDPWIAACFCEKATHLFDGLDDDLSWDTVLDLEPGAHSILTDIEIDLACEAIADFADIKSPYTLGHSSGVAAIARSTGQQCGLPAADTKALWRAGLLHDIGRVGITAATWGKPGALTAREWEQVRLHPYYTERILARPATLRRLGTLAAYHHERIDGSGYHRGAPAVMLSPAARILAAADVYQAMTEPRPHRPAHTPAAAAEHIRREALAGRLDTAAVDGVLTAAGHSTRRSRPTLTAGLSEREVEVLRLLARGNSIGQIAAALVVAPKTVDNHIQHIYNKIGVSTRAGATLFAMEHDLLNPTIEPMQ